MHNRLRLQVLEEASREDAKHPRVAVERARLRKEPVLAAARAVTESRPGDGRGWYLLGINATDPAER